MTAPTRQRLGVATAVLALWSCATTPPPLPAPPAAPTDWSAASDRPQPPELAGPWWSSFEDAELERLIGIALDTNRDLAATAARVEAAAAEARIAGADLLPTIGTALDGSRQRRNFIGFPIPGAGGSVLSTTTTTWASGINIAWEADLWGRLRAGEAAALAELAAADSELAAARLSLTAQTAKAWFGLLEAGRQTELARTTLANRRLTREQIERRYRAGLRGALDLRLARSAESAAASLLSQRRLQNAAAARRLDLLLSRYPVGGLSEHAGELPAPPPPPPAGLPAELIGRRPDLQAAEQRLAAAGYRVGQTRAALYPSLRLTGSSGRSSQEIRDLLDGDFSIWSVIGGLVQPLFQGGRLRAAVALSEARQREAANRFAQAVLRAFAEVETALEAEVRLTEQAAALDQAAREAAAAQRLAEDRYRRGLGDYLSVLAAQRQALDTSGQLLSTRRTLLEARVDLHLALGGDFAPALSPAAGAELASDQ